MRVIAMPEACCIIQYCIQHLQIYVSFLISNEKFKDETFELYLPFNLGIGVGSIHRGLSYIVYSELKPSDVDCMLVDMHVDPACITLNEILLEGKLEGIQRYPFSKK